MKQCFKLMLLFSLVFIFSKKEIKAQTFEGGLVIGFNLSQLDGDALAGWNSIGLNVGGRVAITPYEKWKFNVDILFSQKGSSRTPEQFASSYDKVRLNYVEIPLHVSYMDWLDERGFYRLHFLTGFSYSQLVGFKVLQNGIDTTDLEDYKKWNANFQLGATYFLKENVGINVQYALGLLSVDNDPDSGFFRDRSWASRLIYMF